MNANLALLPPPVGAVALRDGTAVVAVVRTVPVLVVAGGEVRFSVETRPGPEGAWVAAGRTDDLGFERTIIVRADGARVSAVFTALRPVLVRRAVERIDLPGGPPDDVWTPALCPEEGDVVGDHAYRSPLLFIRRGSRSVGMLPDLDVLARQRTSPLGGRAWSAASSERPSDCAKKAFMSYEPGDPAVFSAGFSAYECRHHVYYRLRDEPFRLDAGETLEIAFDLIAAESADPSAALRPYLSFLWARYGSRHAGSVLPQRLPFAAYTAVSLASIARTPEFRRFRLADGSTGAGFRNCSSLGTSDEAASYFGIPVRTIWFHAWFNSFRTAFGARRYADVSGSGTWRRRADEVKRLVLSAPDPAGTGFVPAIYDYDRRAWWWGVPRLGGGERILDITSTVQTAQWMVLWHRHLDPDDRLLERARRIADSLIALQEPDGSFPGYCDDRGRPLPLLAASGHAGMAALFLTELHEYRPEKRLLDAVLKACRFFSERIVPESRYHDFETFFSCSWKPLDFYDRRTGQHAQNNLCLFWIAETFLRAAAFTGDRGLLDRGLYCLDRLSLYQQVWNPPFLSLYTFGGFGVMNTDGEWNDMRQVWFSDAYLRAYLLTGEPEYFERGAAALRAGYALMAHPLHRETNPVRWDSFPAGLVPENYAHNGYDGRAIRSGFDWGGGAVAAMTALTDIRWGGLFVDADRGRAFGIDGVEVAEVRRSGGAVRAVLAERTGRSRRVRTTVLRGGRIEETSVLLRGGGTRTAVWRTAR